MRSTFRSPAMIEAFLHCWVCTVGATRRTLVQEASSFQLNVGSREISHINVVRYCATAMRPSTSG